MNANEGTKSALIIHAHSMAGLTQNEQVVEDIQGTGRYVIIPTL